MVYDLYYKELADSNFKLLRENLTDNFFSIDGQSLADGRYVFRVIAKDSPSNPGANALMGERLSEPVDIDNTAPAVSAFGTPIISGRKARVVFDAVDASSYINRAEYSVNGGEWRAVYADDGISDSARERYSIDVSLPTPIEYSITLRAFDVNGNSGNARVTFVIKTSD